MTARPATDRRPRRANARRLAVIAALVGASVVPPALLAGPATGQAPGDRDDPALDQTIDEGQAVVSGRVVLDEGHVDLGPRLLDGDVELLVHDDGAIPAVWRSLDDTVIGVTDAAIQVVPDDPTYAFLGVDPGAEVHIVPQVQRAGVVWLGWNTQDPALMAEVDRGASLRLLGVEGPGQLVVYLQSGVLGDPEVLWASATPDPQAIWVDVNTHTHANWVFTAPGVYLVQVEVSADLVDGSTVRDVQTIRFAVGGGTDAGAAFDAELATDRRDAEAGGAAGQDPAAPLDGDGGGGVAAPVLVAIAAALVLSVLIAVRSARARRDRQRAAVPVAERDAAPEGRGA